MSESARRSINIFRIILKILLVGSFLTLGFSCYSLIDNDLEENLSSEIGLDDPESIDPGSSVLICLAGIVFFFIAILFLISIIIAAVNMIKSRKEDPRLRSDGLTGGVLILCSLVSGILNIIPFMEIFSGMISTALIYGGFVIFIRSLLSNKDGRSARIAFGSIMAGSVIITVVRIIAPTGNATIIGGILGIISAFFTIPGILIIIRVSKRVRWKPSGRL